MTTEQKLQVIAGAENDATIAQQKLDSKKAAGMEVDPLRAAQASILKARASREKSDFVRGKDIKV